MIKVQTLLISLMVGLSSPVFAGALLLNESDPVVQAVRQNNTQALRIFFKSGGSPFAKLKGKLGETLIEYSIRQASKHAFKNILEFVSKNKLQSKLRDQRGTPLLLNMVSIADRDPKRMSVYVEMMNDLVKVAPEQLIFRDRAYLGDGRTAIHQAAALGSLVLVKELIKLGSSVNALTTLNETPLHYSARYGHLVVTQYLVERGARLEERSKYTNATPLLVASEMGHRSVIRFLLKKGANRNIKDTFGKTSPERFKEFAKDEARTRAVSQPESKNKSKI